MSTPPRRKGPKTLPRLPPSAFSPPNSGVSDSFPLPRSPSTVHPARVVDADATLSALATWKDNAPPAATEVVVVVGDVRELDGLDAQAATAGISILSVQIPFDLRSNTSLILPPSQHRISLRATYASADDGTELAAALRARVVVDLAIDAAVAPGAGASSDGGDGGAAAGAAAWEALEEALGKATAVVAEGGDDAEAAGVGALVLGGILPPPHDLALPIVKLLNHPSYLAYQGHIAALSLLPGTFIKFLPPSWAGRDIVPTEEKERKEWKRRIKMYLGPAVEAFGFERILFGSARTRPADWYALARESVAELGVDQDTIDAIFGGNARRVYGARAAVSSS